MSEEKDKSGTQSSTDPAVEFLKREGLFDDRHGVVDGLGAAKELKHTKGKIKADARRIAERDDHILELEAQLKDATSESDEGTPTPGAKRVAKEALETRKTIREINRELSFLKYPDAKELEGEMAEILADQPALKHLPGGPAKFKIVYDLAKAKQDSERGDSEGDKAGEASRTSAETRGFREPPAPAGSEPPGGSSRENFRSEMDTLLKEVKKKYAAAKGDVEKRKAVVKWHDSQEYDIRMKYGEHD